LLLTSRNLSRRALGLLYRRYDHEWDIRSSTNFIKAIIARPDVAALVSEVKEIERSFRHLEKLPAWDRDSDSTEIICLVVQSLELPQGSWFIEQFRTQQDAPNNLEAALLLYLTPRIEVLSLNCCRL
jgi:hypothetical protein